MRLLVKAACSVGLSACMFWLVTDAFVYHNGVWVVLLDAGGALGFAGWLVRRGTADGRS